MAQNFMNLDTSFPAFTSEQKLDEKVDIIQDYLYMMLEQLRYSMFNLDKGNFNNTGLEEIKEYIIEDTEGNFAEMQLSLTNITTRVGNAEGDISQIRQYADEISLTVEGHTGDISQIVQSADDITLRVASAEGNISTLQTDTSGIGLRVTNAEGNISSLTVTASGLSARVTSAEGNITNLTQTVNSISLEVTNGTDSSTIKMYRNNIAVSSQTIKFTGNVVFASNLTDGITTISGNNIKTGTINANTVSLSSNVGYGIGGFTYSTGFDGTSTTYGAKMYHSDIYGLINNYFIVTNKGTRMTADEQDTGTSIWCMSGSVNTSHSITLGSDRKLKEEINYDINNLDNSFMELKPCTFKYKNRSKNQLGFIAQDVVETANKYNINEELFGVIVRQGADGKDEYAIAYSEYIPLNTHMIQKAYKRIEALEQKVTELESKGA